MNMWYAAVEMGAKRRGSTARPRALAKSIAMSVSLVMGCAATSGGPRDGLEGTGTWKPVDGTGGPTAGLLQPVAIVDGSVILWGGSGPCGTAGACGDGARFDLAAGRFVAMAGSGAPTPRFLHTAVSAAGQMLVWGGAGCGGPSCGDGAAYDPASDHWNALAGAGAPASRGWHTAISTGDEMIVWGGEDDVSRQLLGDGARYDVRRGVWQAVSTDGAPAARRYHSAVWTGTEMLIWGGDRSATTDDGLGDGAAYRPATDRWRGLSSTGAPTARWAHTAVWTGKQMIVWGGLGCGRDGANGPALCGTGGAYDPVADAWTALPTDGAPSPRVGHAAVWTGQQMIIWGGSAKRCADGNSGACDDGAAYDPATGRWAQLAPAGRAAARSGHTAVWTGDAMFVWGGLGGDAAENARHDGALYFSRAHP